MVVVVVVDWGTCSSGSSMSTNSTTNNELRVVKGCRVGEQHCHCDGLMDCLLLVLVFVDWNE